MDELETPSVQIIEGEEAPVLDSSPLLALALSSRAVVVTTAADSSLSLGASGIEVSESPKKTIASRLQELSAVLLSEDPEVWSPEWIKARSLKMYESFCTHFRGDGLVRWSRLLEAVPTCYRNRFFVQNVDNGAVLRSHSEELGLVVRGKRRKLQLELAAALNAQCYPQPKAVVGEESNSEAPTDKIPMSKLEVVAWLRDNNPLLHSKIHRFKHDYDPDFNWYDFIEGVTGGWIAVLVCHAKSLKEYAKKLYWLLKNEGMESWSLYALRRSHSSVIKGVLKHLKKHPDNDGKKPGDESYWKPFFSELPDEVLMKYKAEEDAKSFPVEKRYKTLEERRKASALQIDVMVSGMPKGEWSYTSLVRHDRQASLIFGRTGQSIHDLMPYFADVTLERFNSHLNRMKHHALAERIGRSLGGESCQPWRVTQLRPSSLKRAVQDFERRGHIDLLLACLPMEISILYLPKGCTNAARAKVNNILRIGSEGRVEVVHDILDQHNYTLTGEVTYELLIDLKAEVDAGNRFALITTENMLETYLFDALGHEISPQTGSLVEVLDELEPTQWERKVKKVAARICFDKSVRLDAEKAGKGGDFFKHELEDTRTSAAMV